MATSKRLAAHRETVRAADSQNSSDDEDTQTPAVPGEDDRETPPTTTSTKKEKSMDDATKAAVEAARTEGRETGIKSANERMNAVFASEHYAGREAAAAKMLGKAALSAEDIVDLLADMPKAEPQAAALTEEQRAAADAAGRDEMKAALATTQNSNIEPGGGLNKEQNARAKADSVWDKANAATGRVKKEG